MCRGSFAIKKISNITGKAEAAVPNYRDGTGVIYFTRELHRRAPARTIPHSWDHENAILIMWPIRGHRGLPEEIGRTSGSPCRRPVIKNGPRAIIAGTILCRAISLMNSKVISIAFREFQIFGRNELTAVILARDAFFEYI